MSTIPDLRDLPIVSVTKSEIVQCVGELSAAAIAVCLIIFDGEIGLAAAIGIGGTLAGINLTKRT